MVVTCQIDFDNNPYGTYYAGQMLSGKVTLTADKPKQVKGVLLKINGFADTRWTERNSRNSRRHGSSSSSTTYHGHEDYIASNTYLAGSPLDQPVVVEPGVHVYSFACHIPVTCPSSFEGQYGRVRYTIKVVLVRPWKFDLTFTKGFTVLKIMDLNYDSPILKVPSHIAAQKIFCCGPCKSDPLVLEASLTQSGFVPGQMIPVTLTITNDSRIPVEEVKVSLAMHVSYHSQSPRAHTRLDSTTVAKLKGFGVQRQCKKVFNYDLIVPATPPTCFNSCRILQIAYMVHIEAKVKGWHASQLLQMPVTIGNVPLVQVIHYQPTTNFNMQRDFSNGAIGQVSPNDAEIVSKEIETPQQTAAENLLNSEDKGENMDGLVPLSLGAPETPTAPPPWAIDASIPPPSYEEAVHVLHANITEDESHDFGDKDFTPRYPVFHLPARDEVDTGGTWL